MMSAISRMRPRIRIFRKLSILMWSSPVFEHPNRNAHAISETAHAGSDSPLLEVKNLSKAFGGVSALRAVDFTVPHGEIHGMVGENGAGKSTMMKIIAGMHNDFG